MTKPKEQREDNPESRDKGARAGVAAAVAIAALLALLLGSLVTKVVAGVIALTVLQGLWRGASSLVGLVLGLILAVPVAPFIGRMLDGPVAALSGSSGLLSRFIATGIGAALTVGAVALGIGIVAKRVMRRQPGWKRWDPYAGALLGLAEGSLIALMLLWAPLVLEPIARAQLGEAESSHPPNPVAEAVVGIAERVHGSALGTFAAQTNPVQGSDLLSLAADFAVVSRDRDAMVYLMQTPVMDKIETLPSVQEAVSTLKQDPELTALFEREGISVEIVQRVLNSRTILELFDRTTIVRDMAPLTPELAAAIREARKRAESGSR
jgi:hypothetical protein